MPFSFLTTDPPRIATETTPRHNARARAQSIFKEEIVRSFLTVVSVASIAFVNVAFAQSTTKPSQPPGPCQKVADACKSAGFVKGDWKKGDGLWRDCVDPIMQGQTTVPGGTKPLPAVDAGLVSACKAKHPKYGGGKVGS
jgi:hypothetical protein